MCTEMSHWADTLLVEPNRQIWSCREAETRHQRLSLLSFSFDYSPLRVQWSRQDTPILTPVGEWAEVACSLLSSRQGKWAALPSGRSAGPHRSFGSRSYPAPKRIRALQPHKRHQQGGEGHATKKAKASSKPSGGEHGECISFGGDPCCLLSVSQRAVALCSARRCGIHVGYRHRIRPLDRSGRI